MYKALYRKYRPKTFEDLVGQEVITKTLINSIKNDKLSHAYLFCGPRGTGKTSTAKLLGKLINCENPIELKACDNCVFCTQFNNKQNNDIIEIDAASNNGVDEIRELKSKIDLMPSIGKYKIYIIDEVHMMTTGAFNALLKTLEEPPEHIIFILATTEAHKIPETILSRCQKFDFQKISEEHIIKRLKYICEEENIIVDDISLKEIARISNGGMRDSINLLDQVATFSSNNITLKDVQEVGGTVNEKLIYDLIEMVLDNNISYVLEKVDEISNLGKNIVKFTEDIILFLRNILLYKEANEYLKKTGVDLSLYSKIDSKLANKKLIQMIEIFNNSLYQMKSFNQPKIALELAIISLITDDNNISMENNSKEKVIDNVTSVNKEETITELKTPKLELDPEFEKFRNIRINNTLAKFNKKILINIKEQIENLKPLLLDPSISEFVSLLLDGEIKAASEDYLIFVYPNDRMVRKFDLATNELESVIESNFNKYYKIVSTDIENWENIKKEFNSKTKKYEIQEEIDICIQNTQNVVTDEMSQLFGDIVEYN